MLMMKCFGNLNYAIFEVRVLNGKIMMPRIITIQKRNIENGKNQVEKTRKIAFV